MILAVLTIIACGQTPKEAMVGYQDALTAIAVDANNTASVCATLLEPQLKVDCHIAGAEALAGSNPDAAAALCANISPQINDGVSHEECLFQVAERSAEPERCAHAGRFADPCRMHLWGSSVPALAGTSWTEKEASAEKRIPAYGLNANDPRPWVALYRWLLSEEQPLTRVHCSTSRQMVACREAGISLLRDRLNRAVGLNQLSCAPDAALPPLLQVREDEELTRMISTRRETICR
jgi:hypothetical protein